MIYKKLLEFQKLGISVKKNADNPYFKSKYVPLNEVLDKVKEPLNKLGVVIVQKPQIEGLLTVLHDTEDDTFIEGIMPYVETSTAQKLGSCNTYNRRYSLITMLGLEDEDDDGNEASGMNESEAFKAAFQAIKEETTPKGWEKLKVEIADSKKLKDSERRALIALADEKLYG